MNLFVPEELKHLIGKVSEEELRQKIALLNAMDTYILKHGKPISMEDNVTFGFWRLKIWHIKN